MSGQSLRELGRGYPYESKVEVLIDEVSEFETRLRPKDPVEVDRFELDYGWQAILYEENCGLIGNIGKKLADLSGGSTNYGSAPDYQWELRAPDGEAYRKRGVDISEEEFEDLITLLEQ